MANENVIQATFDGFYKTYTEPSWFIDHGMELSISGIDLPDEFECHFSNTRSVAAKRQIGENGVVTIPDEYFLSNAAQIFCWIYLHPTVDSGVTEYEIVIPLLTRPNVDPAEPTQEQQDIVDQAIAALNVAMAATSDDVESASASATAAQAAVDSVLNMTVSADTLPAGYDAYVTKSVVDDSVHLAFGIPQGAQGVQGPTGATPNFSIGTVQALLPTQDATATITGTAEAPVLNLGIPKGYSGDATNLAADYSSSKTYSVGEYCIYNGTLYRCTTHITTAEAWTAGHWAAAVLGDDVSNLKSAIDSVEDEVFILSNATVYATSANWKLAGNGLSSQDSSAQMVKYQVTAGERLYLKLSADTSGVYQFQNNASVPGSGTNSYLIGSPVTSAVDGFVTVPTGATYLIVSSLKSNTTNKVQRPSSAIGAINSKIATDEAKFTESTKNLNVSGQGRYYANSRGSIISSSGNYIGMPGNIEVTANAVYTVTFYDTGVAAGTIFVCWYDASGNLIDSRASYAGPTKTLTAPSTAKYLHVDLYDGSGVSADAKIQIEAGTKSTYYVPSTTAVDGVARGEIAELVGDAFPAYYDSQVENVLSLIGSNADKVGSKGESFIFVTDPHWGHSAKHTPDIVHYLINNTNVRNVVCGGDVLDSGEKAFEISKGKLFMDCYRFVPGGLKMVIGNHDSNKNQHTDDSSYWLTCEEIYHLLCAQAKMEMQDFHMPTGKVDFPYCYYYFDVPATNTRFVISGAAYGSVTDAEKTWLTAQLTDNPDKNFVIVGHYLYELSEGALSSAGQAISTIADAHSNVFALITGHTHQDAEIYTAGGIPVLVTDTDASSRLADTNPNTSTIGTITECAFDTVTVGYSPNVIRAARIGRGKNRIMHGGANAVSSTLSLTSELESPVWSSTDSSVATVSNGVVSAVSTGKAIIKATTSDTVEMWLVTVM